MIVQEGNTELADGSLVISGYDVSGKVSSENDPVAGVSFILSGVRFLLFSLLSLSQYLAVYINFFPFFPIERFRGEV